MVRKFSAIVIAQSAKIQINCAGCDSKTVLHNKKSMNLLDT